MSRSSSAPACAADSSYDSESRDKKIITRNNSCSPPRLAITGSPPLALNGGNVKKPRYLQSSPDSAEHHHMPPPQRHGSISPSTPGMRYASLPPHYPSASSGSYQYPAIPPDAAPRDYSEYSYQERPYHYPPYRSSMTYPYQHRGPYSYHYATPIKPNNKKRNSGEISTPPRGAVDPRFSSSPSASHESGKTSCESNTTISSNDSFVTSPRHMKEFSQQYYPHPHPHPPGDQYPPPMDPHYYYHYYHPVPEHHRAMPHGAVPPPMEPHHMPSYAMHPPYPGMPEYAPVPHHYYGTGHPEMEDNNSRPGYQKHYPPPMHHRRSYTPAFSVTSSIADDDSKVPSDRMSDGAESTTSYSRKDRALGLLCERFLARCCYRPDRDYISIDEAARTLSVEKRRIYDIINILEAIHVVSRKCKDTYNWHGTAHLPMTFAKLQKHALHIWKKDGINHGLIPDDSDEGSAQKKQSSNSSNPKPETCGIQMLLESAKATTSSSTSDEKQYNDNDGIVPQKEKSLARLCRCFIQLFLVGNDVISLNEACDKILQVQEEEDSNKKKEGSVKTKVRRLYDVANVMVSLGIVVKVGNPKNGNPKNSRPIFKWIYNMSPKEMQRLHDKSDSSKEK